MNSRILPFLVSIPMPDLSVSTISISYFACQKILKI
jgi:hypothetical protein